MNNMFNTLKKHLILFLGLSTSLILTIVIILILAFNFNMQKTHDDELFQANFNTLLEKIKYSSSLSHIYLKTMENDYNLIIYIESNGRPLYYNTFYASKNDHNSIINIVKKKGLNEGIDLSLNPIDSSMKYSSKYNFKYNGQFYSGMECIIPSDSGYKSFIMIKNYPYESLNNLNRIILGLILDCIGCTLLFILSRIFISKAFVPVEMNTKRQTEFIAAASHELRSPLTVIKAAVSSLKNDSSLFETYIPNIEHECTRMSRLISDMLLLANSDAKNWTLNKSIVDMDTLLIETYDLFCPFFKSTKQNFSLNLPNEPLSEIYADKERIVQVLSILLDNASEYTPENKDIKINAYNNENYIIIEVCDNGIGISDDQKENIFNRFYRIDKARTSKKHFGLGLSIALELIKLHNGKINVCDTKGGGATFIISLPVN